MNKLLCIVGPTGTGKTKIAIKESIKQPSILVSADSRQVYRGMDIVTGKDHPQDITLYGIDLVNPDEPCSVAVWYDAVIQPIRQAWAEGKQVIVVGGTGLYVKAITSGIATISVPINQPLRDALESLSIPELQRKLNLLNPTKLAGMNHSDLQNPRRLVRAIEIAQSTQVTTSSQTVPTFTSQIIGINPPSSHLYYDLVKQRVLSRIKLGAVEETQSLLSKYGKDIQSLTAIGYQSIVDFIDGKLTQVEMVESWVASELSYAKRQLTWFRKQPVVWYDRDNI